MGGVCAALPSPGGSPSTELSTTLLPCQAPSRKGVGASHGSSAAAVVFLGSGSWGESGMQQGEAAAEGQGCCRGGSSPWSRTGRESWNGLG